MTVHSRRSAALLLLAATMLMAGCASTHTSSHTSRPTDVSMSPGMTMPNGSVMGAPPSSSASSSPAEAQSAPSASARMICGPEIRRDVATVLALKTQPIATSRWADGLYTCTYTLPSGPLVLSVKDLPDAAATTTYFNTVRGRLGNPPDLAGLGQGAYGTRDGAVVLRKDNHVLHVDATALPATFGAQHQKRTDFAYEIASDILGCWTGD
jgi:hypothetical protein